MSCLGVHFAIMPDIINLLLEATDDSTLKKIVYDIEEAWDEGNLIESGKAWDAIHRLLTDGTLGKGNGEYPLNHCIIGPRQLHKERNYIISLVLPQEVCDVAKALLEINRKRFEDRYCTLLSPDYGSMYGEEDLEYTWSHFTEIVEFYQIAAKSDRGVIFTVDQ